MAMTGEKKMFFAVLTFFCGMFAQAAELRVVPSSTEISIEENLSLEFRVSADSMSASVGEPKYSAPDFDEVNSYSQMSSFNTVINNGSISMRQTKSFVVILHPKKQGKLLISGISIPVSGTMLRAPDVTIDVSAAGARPSNRGGTGNYGAQRGQLQGSNIHSGGRNSAAPTIVLKTEPSKLKAYKGEQVILTYAIYVRANIMNIQVERYPNIKDFLKEDIDIPLLRGPLQYARSVLNGVEYNRAALAQYAIYPLKEGVLPIDVFTGKFSYHSRPRAMNNDDDEDPFQVFNQFFRSMQVVSEVKSSDRIEIEVLPLPGAGQPASFSGLVGDFDISASTDKTTAKVGEAINVKVKIEGKGHAGSLEKLTVQWPADFELYEDKSHTQFLKTGFTERFFDYLVIPKTKGSFTIPAVEISMFNPETRSYQTKRTQPIKLEVLEGSLGSVYQAKAKPDAKTVSKEDIRYWMSEEPSLSLSATLTRIFQAALLLAFGLLGLGFYRIFKVNEASLKERRQKRVSALKQKLEALMTANWPAAKIFAGIESLLAETIDIRYGLKIGSLTRVEITRTLIEQYKVNEAVAVKIEELLEFCEFQRYAPGGGNPVSARKGIEDLKQLMLQLATS